MRLAVNLTIFLFALLVLVGTASAKGYLATRPIKLEPLVLGTEATGYGMSVKEYKLETGKAYRLKIRSTGAKEYALIAPEFFDFIWLRKVEAGDMEIKANSLYELEFEREGECEIFFVPIRPGRYEFKVRGLEAKGMVGTFVVE